MSYWQGQAYHVSRHGAWCLIDRVTLSKIGVKICCLMDRATLSALDVSLSQKAVFAYLKSKWIIVRILLWASASQMNTTISLLGGGGPRVVVSTAVFHARVRGSVPGLGGLKETKMFLPHPRVKVSIVGSLRDREVACSASDRQGSNFESCVWRTVSSQSSHHPQEVLLAQFSLYVHKGGLKPDSFHFISLLGVAYAYLRSSGWHATYCGASFLTSSNKALVAENTGL